MSWDDLAAGWERWADLTSEASAPVDAWFLQALSPRPGETVLDVGAGTGDAALLIAERVTPSGVVIITDAAPAMVEAARHRARRARISNIDAVVMDAQDLDLADGVVDAVLCRWTLYLLPDPDRAMREMARVVRPGGRVAIGIWAETERNPMVPLLGSVLARRGHMDPPPRGGFNLGGESGLAGMMRAAGLVPALVEEVPFAWRFASLDEAWEYVRDTGGGTARVLARMSEREQAAVRADWAESAEPYVEPGGRVSFPAVAVNALAVRPG